MPKGKPITKYTGEFKRKVIEHMLAEHLGYCETARLFQISGHERIRKWERIYLEEGPEGFEKDRRSKGPKVGLIKPPRLDKKAEEDLISENQRLRMENDYLKKLNALVQERQLRERKPR